MSLESTQWSSSYSRPRCIERDVSIATGGTDVTWQPVVCRSRLQHPLVGGELETINLLFRRAHIVETHLKDLTWYLKPVGSNLIICHHSHRIIFMQYNLFVGGSICSIAGRTWQSPPFFGGRGVLSASVVWPGLALFFSKKTKPPWCSFSLMIALWSNMAKNHPWSIYLYIKPSLEKRISQCHLWFPGRSLGLTIVDA